MTLSETTGAGETPVPQRTTSPAAADQERPVPSADERADTAPRPDRPADPLQHAWQLAQVGEMTAAMTILRALIAREPKHVRARQVMAELLAQKGDLEGAITELSRALEIAPDDVPNLCARAALYVSRARYDQAESDLKRAVKLGDRDPDVQVQLGVLFCKRARWREAIDPLRAAVAADPQHAAAHYHLGDAYNAAVDALVRLRAQHIGITGRYIKRFQSDQETAKGTGGSDFVAFLKKSREETSDRLLP